MNVPTSSMDDLIRGIFGSDPKPPYSIVVDLDEETFDLNPDEDTETIQTQFYCDIMFQGMNYLFGDSVSPLDVMKDLEKFRLITRYMASIGVIPRVMTGHDPDTNEIKAVQIIFDPAPRLN